MGHRWLVSWRTIVGRVWVGEVGEREGMLGARDNGGSFELGLEAWL